MQIEFTIPTREQFEDMVRDSDQEVTAESVANLAWDYSSLERLAELNGVDPSTLSANSDAYTWYTDSNGARQKSLKEGATVTMTRTDGEFSNLDRPFNTTIFADDISNFMDLELTRFADYQPEDGGYTLTATTIPAEGLLGVLERDLGRNTEEYGAAAYIIQKPNKGNGENEGFEYLTGSLSFYTSHDALVEARGLAVPDAEPLDALADATDVEPFDAFADFPGAESIELEEPYENLSNTEYRPETLALAMELDELTEGIDGTLGQSLTTYQTRNGPTLNVLDSPQRESGKSRTRHTVFGKHPISDNRQASNTEGTGIADME